MTRPAPAQTPLFVWHEAHEVEALRARRAVLLQRLNTLPTQSFRAVELRAELRLLTRNILELELLIRRGAAR